MDRLGSAQGRFIRAGNGAGASPTDGSAEKSGPEPARSERARPQASMTRRLDALATAAMTLGWECVQAATESDHEPLIPPDLEPDSLAASLGPHAPRPGSASDWDRFDAAWGRVRREIGSDDLTSVGLALLDFAQACRITAARLGDAASQQTR